METKKYWKNIIHGPFYHDLEPGMAGTSLWAHHNEYKNGITLGYHCINDEYYVPIVHHHDFHELLCFIGGNPENMNDLGAEISICLGDEMEEHIISNATIVSIPPGLTHCPLKVRKVTRPFIFLEISTTNEYGDPTEIATLTEEQFNTRKKTASVI